MAWSAAFSAGRPLSAPTGLRSYAMTRAPIAAVAALRETSILFALLISVFILKEKASPGAISQAC